MTQANILLILSDQHAFNVSGPYGHPIVQTPNLDRLAAEGVVFENNYCNSPICVPSRMSLMTGQHLRNNGIWDNGVPLPSDKVTWAHQLKSAGYDVVLSGKMHFRGLDQLHGFRAQLAYDINAQNLPKIRDWDEVLEQREPSTAIKAETGRSKEIDADDAVTVAALDYLRDSVHQDRPWALVVGYVAPHPPFVVPQKYLDMYPPEDMDLPIIPEGHLENLHVAYQRQMAWRGWRPGGISDENIRRARAVYYGLTTYLDDQIGMLLDALDETGQRENTIIIYMSDHGEMLGEHGLWYKCDFYEQSAHVPLIISAPGISGQRISLVTSNVDVTATLLDLAGVESISPIDGNSLIPLIMGTAKGWKNEALSEFYADGSTRPWAMLRQGQYKLIYSHEDPLELYDLKADPGEFNNLAKNPDYQDVVERLRASLLARWDPQELDRRIRQSQKERRLIYDDLFAYLLEQ
jgi:choline-sulfatase